jgi:PAS domain S-box-containing protein
MFTGATTLFVCAYFLLNTALVAGAVAFGRDVPWLGVWREHFLPLWITYVLGGFVAALIVVAARDPHLGPSAMFALGLVALALAGLREVAQRLENRSKTLSDLRTYAAALRSTADAVILLNPAGRITFINPAGEELTGWQSRDAQGHVFADVVRLAPLNGTASDSSHPSDLERLLLARSGETRQVEETRATIRDEDGSVIGTIATLRDISARKTIETARREAFRREREARRAADEANRAKDEFLAIVSHELRTPAGAIAGWTRLLKTGQLDSFQTEKALAALERNVRAQNTVLNDLLDVSRIVRGALRLERRRVDLAAILNEAIDTVQPAREAREIVLTVNLESPLVIDADPDRLRQVFWNLLANAVKFTPRGGRIQVEAHRLGDLVSVAVTDTGSGIDPSFLPYVFEPFRQADQSPTRQHGGLGLGLAIVRHLIEAHGGTVQASSEGLGSGSRFTVTLPGTITRRTGDLT